MRGGGLPARTYLTGADLVQFGLAALRDFNIGGWPDRQTVIKSQPTHDSEGVRPGCHQ